MCYGENKLKITNEKLNGKFSYHCYYRMGNLVRLEHFFWTDTVNIKWQYFTFKAVCWVGLLERW